MKLDYVQQLANITRNLFPNQLHVPNDGNARRYGPSISTGLHQSLDCHYLHTFCNSTVRIEKYTLSQYEWSHWTSLFYIIIRCWKSFSNLEPGSYRCWVERVTDIAFGNANCRNTCTLNWSSGHAECVRTYTCEGEGIVKGSQCVVKAACNKSSDLNEQRMNFSNDRSKGE